MSSNEEAPAIITNKALMPKWANLKAFQNFSIEFLEGKPYKICKINKGSRLTNIKYHHIRQHAGMLCRHFPS